MSSIPCNVCGNTDLNLVDGFYYCAECGTQDANVRETVIEYTVLADGTLGHTTAKKFTTNIKDGIEMSGEWHKWHAYNFILSGWTEELIALGANATVKMRVLWIWTRYIKEFQILEDLGLSQLHDDSQDELKKHKNSNEGSDDDDSDEEDNRRKRRTEKSKTDIKTVTKSLLLSIIYVALNLDESDIQISHLLRFIEEGRLSYLTCMKFVPKEINLKAIPQWKNFSLGQTLCNGLLIRNLAFTLFKRLDLGIPKVPDLKKIVENFISELCLPKDFSNLIFSLIYSTKGKFLEFVKSPRSNSIRILDYEACVMSFVIIAMKMCFGLDNEYEYELSDSIDKININENYRKSHKLGVFEEISDRQFNFREWLNYLKFRKNILCKHYLPMARKYNLEVDDYVFMEHLEPRPKVAIKLSDEVTMDILNKMPQNDSGRYIPKAEFIPTLTPLTTYTEVVIQYIKDPDLRLLLSEDFTQYSLKYVYENIKLPIDDAIYLSGVTTANKNVNKLLEDTRMGYVVNDADVTTVYVRNCENKNWLKTNPPKSEHITVDKDSDLDPGYDSNSENSVNANKPSVSPDITKEEIKVLESIVEDFLDRNIYDDSFNDVDKSEFEVVDKSEFEVVDKSEFEDINDMNDVEPQEFPESCLEANDGSPLDDSKQNEIDENVDPVYKYNPDTFNRGETIKELILYACKKHKIPIPAEYNSRRPSKRRLVTGTDNSQDVEKKKHKTEKPKPGEVKAEVDKLITAYYENLNKEVLNQLSAHVQSMLNCDVQVSDDHCDNADLLDSKDDVNSTKVDTNFECHEVIRESSEDRISEVNEVEVNNSDDESVANLISKGDPKFDEDIYNPNQLYIKLKNEFNFDDDLDLGDDPEIEKIFNKTNEQLIVKQKINKLQNDEVDSDDDIALNILKREIEEIKVQNKEKPRKLKHLAKVDKLDDFKYWIRHYNCAQMFNKRDIKQRFDLELKEYFPTTFCYIFMECAGILECSAFVLYKHFQRIEELVFKC